MRVTTREVPLAITAPATHPAAKLRPGSILETSWPRTVSALAHVGVTHAATPARPAQMAGLACLLVMTKCLPRGGDGARRLSTGLRRRAHQASGGQSGNGLVCLVCVYRRSNNYSSWCIGTSWREGCFLQHMGTIRMTIHQQVIIARGNAPQTMNPWRGKPRTRPADATNSKTVALAHSTPTRPHVARFSRRTSGECHAPARQAATARRRTPTAGPSWPSG